MVKKFLKILTYLTIFLWSVSVYAYPYSFRDTTGRIVTLTKRPTRVVCLVPSVTEMIFRVGGGDTVVGVTYHSATPPEAALKPVVGGFLFPSVSRIASLHPDLIFASRQQVQLIKTFNKRCTVVVLEANSMKDIDHHIKIIGQIFNREVEALRLVRQIKSQLSLIKRKVSLIPLSKRKRVMRIMGRTHVMAPGDDSFQDEFIRLAGGIPPTFGKRGPIVTVSKEAWERFNPQVIYACGHDRKIVQRILTEPGWKEVDAVKNHAIYFFPCALTCRPSTHAAYFISWLSSVIYHEEYAKKSFQVSRDGIVHTQKIHLPFSYIDQADIVSSHIADFTNKTLLIHFKIPMMITSTLEGQRSGITTIGNHYLPPQLWYISHQMGFHAFRKRVFNALKLNEKTSSLLFTGADMSHLSVQTRRYKKIQVTVLVTAGVRSNAMRMSKDVGKFYEPGTINMILMTNCRLTPRAMARAFITITEAKTAALQDLDIRSAFTGKINQATGTGTDNIIVVEGAGIRIDNTGGHTKMGELIAKAVYAGVKRAIFKQNGIAEGRNVFQRLEERGISLYSLIPSEGLNHRISRMEALQSLESLLLQPRYAAFMETAMALSDRSEAGLIKTLQPFDRWCTEIAGEIAGKAFHPLKNLMVNANLPPALKMAFNALLNGMLRKQR